ncbi:MAG: blue light sensor protein [Deltaproteobacteria bacterium]|nr:blue light sensor protein [Deltaproteobacteria bacterium]
MLNRLVYASYSVETMNERMIQTVLEQSRLSNAEHGVTGMLCVDPRRDLFLQVLEGSRSAVNQLYANIIRDPRHVQVTLLAYEEIAERSFSAWRMGSTDLAKVNPGVVLRFSETEHFDPLTIPGTAALALVQKVAGVGSNEGK